MFTARQLTKYEKRCQGMVAGTEQLNPKKCIWSYFMLPCFSFRELGEVVENDSIREATPLHQRSRWFVSMTICVSVGSSVQAIGSCIWLGWSRLCTTKMFLVQPMKVASKVFNKIGFFWLHSCTKQKLSNTIMMQLRWSVLSTRDIVQYTKSKK